MCLVPQFDSASSKDASPDGAIYALHIDVGALQVGSRKVRSHSLSPMAAIRQPVTTENVAFVLRIRRILD